jgi:hypothetical protein
MILNSMVQIQFILESGGENKDQNGGKEKRQLDETTFLNERF